MSQPKTSTPTACEVCGREQFFDKPRQPDTSSLPQIAWVKNDPKLHNYFEDGTVILGALQVRNEKLGKNEWEFDVVQFNCDGDGAHLQYRGGEVYDAWTFEDFEYFHLLEGKMPTAKPDGYDD